MKNDKTKYENIEIPKELDQMINQTIENEQKERRRKSSRKRWIAIAAAVALFVTPLNVSQGFADTMAEIPVLGSIAKVLTFRLYRTESQELLAEVKVPEVAEMDNQNFEDQVNALIQEKVEITLAQAQKRAEEYKKAYLETGGTEEEYEKRKIQAAVDYTVYVKSQDTLSFMLFSYDTVAAAYAEYTYYNLDLQNNREWTLEDLLGENYAGVITELVKGQMKTQIENEGMAFWDEVNAADWKVREDIDFYINEKGNPVVVFDKYEIAAGAFGRLEYEIESN